MKGRKWEIVMFLAYCALMVWLLFGRAQYEPSLRAENFNPMPFVALPVKPIFSWVK